MEPSTLNRKVLGEKRKEHIGVYNYWKVTARGLNTLKCDLSVVLATPRLIRLFLSQTGLNKLHSNQDYIVIFLCKVGAKGKDVEPSKQISLILWRA